MQNNISEITLVLIAGSFIVLLLAVVIIFSLFTNQKRKFRHQQQLEEQKKIFEQEILKAQMEIQAQTFETISHELHDNVSNTLSVALLNINLINGSNEESAERLNESKKLILEAKNAVKDFSWSINPENISRAGLASSLKQLAEKFSKLKLLNVHYEITGEEFQLESSKQIIIYRIVQESLSNILKHADSDSVFLRIEFAKPGFKIVIQDNGSGFDVKEKLANDIRGNGLKNMTSRARMINAQLDIDSTPGKGTTTVLSYPAVKQETLISHT
jgi:signal transduction histidine kinase